MAGMLPRCMDIDGAFFVLPVLEAAVWVVAWHVKIANDWQCLMARSQFGLEEEAMIMVWMREQRKVRKTRRMGIIVGLLLTFASLVTFSFSLSSLTAALFFFRSLPTPSTSLSLYCLCSRAFVG